MTHELLHETATRLRLRLATRDGLRRTRAALELLPGVLALRSADAARSLTVHYDGRAATRRAILAATARRTDEAHTDAARPRRRRPALPLEAPLAVSALAPLLPPKARPALALAIVAAKAWADRRNGQDASVTLLDTLSLATAALTGHPLTATTSVLLGTVAERRRDALLEETDELLARLLPAPRAAYPVTRGARRLQLPPDALLAGDRLVVEAGTVLPADALVLDGRAEAAATLAADAPTLHPGVRVHAGTRLLSGRIEVQVEHPAAESRAARLRAHVQHLLRTRDAPGPLTPDLERLLALPITAAGLVLALTGDAARTASMLQADPQLGIALAQPVAREAALYATARSGALLASLTHLERLATATTVAFEDVGVLAESTWHLDQVDSHDPAIDAAQANRWLTQLTGRPGAADAQVATVAGFTDAQVAAWRAHGALLRDHARELHIAGAACIDRTWGVVLPEPDRTGLVRRLGVVEHGRLCATLHLRCRLAPDIARHFSAMRRLGVRRIAVFTEDTAAQPAALLGTLGADVVVSDSRSAQARWLEAAVERGERVLLVHTGLRDVLPAGALSLCPIDAAAGADGVLLGPPLPSLLASIDVARSARKRLRAQFGRSITLNAALMVAAALRLLPPIVTTGAKHASIFLLLQQATRLAQLRTTARAPARAEPKDAAHSAVLTT